jgi:hypothetical protein
MRTTLYFLAMILLSTSTLSATTYYVRSNGNNAYDGKSEGAAFKTLVYLFNFTMEDGDVIDIGEGTFACHNSYVLDKGVTIKGAGKNATFISGTADGANNLKNCFNVTAASTAVIEDLTFKDFGTLGGDTFFINNGGVLSISGDLTLRRVNFVNNRAYRGGAVSATRGTVLMEDCTFSGNAAAVKTAVQPQAGAIFANSSSQLLLTVDRCLFENNSSYYRGSAMFINLGGAVGSTMLMQNSTFTGNAITGSGGAGCIYYAPGTAASDAEGSFINNTIACNTAASGTSGLIIGQYAAGRVVFINNIVFGNQGSNGISVGGKYLKESRNNLTDVNFDFAAKTADGASSDNQSNVTAENLALATALADNGGQTRTLAIASGSIAKDAGYATGAPATDQTGYIRSTPPDVGAYEWRIVSTIHPSVVKGSIEYTQNDGKIVFNNVAGYHSAKIYTVAGRLLQNIPLSGDSFEYSPGAGIYVFRFDGQDNQEIIKAVLTK